MSSTPPTLHLLCGKVASGKSTLTRELGAQPGTVVIAEDAWLAALYPGEMSAISDYVRCAARLEAVLGPHTISLLQAGLSVVLDFHANTISRRAWMRSLIEAADAAHALHFLDIPDETCLARLRARNARGDHPFAVSESQFAQINKHFVPPSPDEGFNVVIHSEAR